MVCGSRGMKDRGALMWTRTTQKGQRLKGALSSGVRRGGWDDKDGHLLEEAVVRF